MKRQPTPGHPPVSETPPRRRLGARSNLFLPPDLEARIARVAAAYGPFFGAPAGATPARVTDIKRLALEIGVTALEAKLGIGPAVPPTHHKP